MATTDVLKNILANLLQGQQPPAPPTDSYVLTSNLNSLLNTKANISDLNNKANVSDLDSKASLTDLNTKLSKTGDGSNVTSTVAGRSGLGRPLISRFSDYPISITDYGVTSGQNVVAALSKGFADSVLTGRPLFMPAGVWVVDATTNFPTANNKCAGLVGEDANTILATVNYNGPAIRATVQPGVPLSEKLFKNINYQGQWSANPTVDQTALLEVVGSVEGMSFSNFEDLRAYAVQNLIRFNTTALVTQFGNESQCGWNVFKTITIGAGSQNIRVQDGIYFKGGSSTGNCYYNFRGGGTRAMIRCEGAGCVVGDLVAYGMHVGSGYMMSCASDTVYRRNSGFNNTQIDAGSVGALHYESGTITPQSLKMMGGTLGGTNPWEGIPAILNSRIDDLGASEWMAGGTLVTLSPGTHSNIPLWKITLSTNTMVTFEVSIQGLVGGLDGGGTVQTFNAACSYNGVTQCLAAGPAVSMAPVGYPSGNIPSQWPVFSTVVTNNTVTVQVTWTDTAQSNLNTNISARHGCFKVQRVLGRVNY